MKPRFRTTFRLSAIGMDTVIACLETARFHYGNLGKPITHPRITSRWFRMRETVSAWIAPPIPTEAWTEIIITSEGKVRVREVPQ